MNRFKVASTAMLVVVALCAFLLQPDNLTVWRDPHLAGVVIGAIAVVSNVVTMALPSWTQSGPAEAAVRRTELPPRG